MLGDRLYMYPLILAVYVPLAFITTYIIAVANDHVEAGFPYISDTGTRPPESCVFGQLLNIGAVIGLINVYVRYRQIKEHYSPNPIRKITILNTITFVLGLIMALGVSMVGNFQETNVVVVHVLGAFMAFAIGSIYIYVQSGMSFSMTDLHGISKTMRYIRVLISLLDFALLVVLAAASTASRNDLPENFNYQKWSSSDPNFQAHLTATISEWLIALLIVLFFLTYIPEFRQFRMAIPELHFHKTPQVQNGEAGSSNPTFQEDTGTGSPA